MKTVLWLVQMKSAPTVLRYCKKCGKQVPFMSSGLFRVNAQRKSLDIWLIYKCTQCDSTWNFTVLSRVNPRALPPETLSGFQNNDAALAMRYAADGVLIRHNGGEPCAAEIEIVGDMPDLREGARLRIVPTYPVEIKLAALLRSQLGLSRSEYEKHCASGKIRCVSGQDLKKAKLLTEIIVEIE